MFIMMCFYKLRFYHSVTSSNVVLVLCENISCKNNAVCTIFKYIYLVYKDSRQYSACWIAKLF